MIFDTLSNLETYAAVIPSLVSVAEAMDHDDIYSLSPGVYNTPNPRVSYAVSETSTTASDQPFRFHRKRTVVEIVLSGEELVSTSWRELCEKDGRYSKDTDTGFLNAEPVSAFRASQGRFFAFLPGEPYKSGVSGVESGPVRRVVFTISEE